MPRAPCSWMDSPNPFGAAAWMAITRDANEALFLCARLHASVPRRCLDQALKAGAIKRVFPGVVAGWKLPAEKQTPLAIACAILPPTSFFSLSTAAWIHGFFCEEPKTHCITIPHKARQLQMPLRVRWFRNSGDRLQFGIEVVPFRSLQIPVTAPERTVADAFQFSGRLRPDEPESWLASYLRRPDADRSLLLTAARLCRVETRLMKAVHDRDARLGVASSSLRARRR